jgi:hypothetical protein
MKLSSASAYVTFFLTLTVALCGCGKPQPALDNPMPLSATDDNMIRANIKDVLQTMFFEVEQPPRTAERIDTYPLVSAHGPEFWRPDIRTFADWNESNIHTVRRTVTVFLHPVAQPPEPPPMAEPGSDSAGDVPSGAAAPRLTAEVQNVPSGAAAVPPTTTTLVGPIIVLSPPPRPPQEASDWSKGLSVEVVVKKERVDTGTPFTASDISEFYSIFRAQTDTLDNFEDKWSSKIRWIDYGRDPALEQYILHKIRARF